MELKGFLKPKTKQAIKLVAFKKKEPMLSMKQPAALFKSARKPEAINTPVHTHTYCMHRNMKVCWALTQLN